MNSTIVNSASNSLTLTSLGSSLGFVSAVAGFFVGRGDSDPNSSSGLCFRFGLDGRFGLGVRRGLWRRGLVELGGRRGIEARYLSPSEIGPLITTISLVSCG